MVENVWGPSATAGLSSSVMYHGWLHVWGRLEFKNVREPCRGRSSRRMGFFSEGELAVLADFGEHAILRGCRNSGRCLLAPLLAPPFH